MTTCTLSWWHKVCGKWKRSSSTFVADALPTFEEACERITTGNAYSVQLARPTGLEFVKQRVYAGLRDFAPPRKPYKFRLTRHPM